jgi:hypothetical protein
MINGKRVGAIEIDHYAVARDGPRHVRTQAQAMVWAGRIQADWIAGRNPRLSPVEQQAESQATVRTVEDLVVAYRRAKAPHPVLDVGHAPPRALEQPQVLHSELRHIAGFFGTKPATYLETEAHVQQFRDELYESSTRGGHRRARMASHGT